MRAAGSWPSAAPQARRAHHGTLCARSLRPWGGAQRRDLHHTLDAALGCRARDGVGGFYVERFEILLAAFMQHGDQVHDGVRIFKRRIDRFWKAHVRLHELDLPNIAHHAKLLPHVRTAHRDAHALATLGQRANDLFADESGTAEHNDQIATHEALHQPRFSAHDR